MKPFAISKETRLKQKVYDTRRANRENTVWNSLLGMISVELAEYLVEKGYAQKQKTEFIVEFISVERQFEFFERFSSMIKSLKELGQAPKDYMPTKFDLRDRAFSIFRGKIGREKKSFTPWDAYWKMINSIEVTEQDKKNVLEFWGEI